MNQEDMNEMAWKLLSDLETLEFNLINWNENAMRLIDMDKSKGFLRDNVSAVNKFLKDQGCVEM